MFAHCQHRLLVFLLHLHLLSFAFAAYYLCNAVSGRYVVVCYTYDLSPFLKDRYTQLLTHPLAAAWGSAS